MKANPENCQAIEVGVKKIKNENITFYLDNNVMENEHN